MSNCPVLLQSVLDRYDYTRTLSRSRWAWEFLRRNEEFLAEAALHGPDEVSVRTACHGITLIRPRTDQMAAERWGLAFFPDPRHDGFVANAFWSSALFPRQVQVQVSPAGPGEACPIYERTVKQCGIVHLVDTAGREHILVKGNGHVVQVQCTGMSMLSPEPVRLGFLIRGTANFASRWRMLDEAQRVYDASQPEPRRGPGRVLPFAMRWSRMIAKRRDCPSGKLPISFMARRGWMKPGQGPAGR